MTATPTPRPNRPAHPPVRGAARRRRGRQGHACAAGWPAAASTASTWPSSTCATTSGVIQCVIDNKVDVRSEWVIAVEGHGAPPPGRARMNPGHRHRRGRGGRLHRGGPQRGRAAALLGRRPRRVRRAGPPALPLRRPAPPPHAAQPAPAGPGQRRHPRRHGPAGVLRGRDPAAVGAHPGGLPRVLGAQPAAPRFLLRPAPEPAAGQAAPHGGRLRPLLPDRPLPARRGPAGRPAVRVLPAGHGGLVRQPGRRHGLRLRGRARCRRGRHRRAPAAHRPHDVGRCPRPLRHGQARPALRHGAGRPERRVRRHRGAGLLRLRTSRRCCVAERRHLHPFPPRRADRAGQAGRRRRPGLVPGRRSADAGRPALALDSPLDRFLSEPERAAILEKTGAEEGDLILAVSDTHRIACTALGTLRAALGSPPVGQGPHRYVWVVDFPMFDGVDAEGNPQAAHHPFTMPYPEDMPLLDTVPFAVRSQAYDLVLNGWELGSGSVRIHRRDIQARIFDTLGISARGGRGPVRLPAQRLPLRGPAARRLRLRHRPPGRRAGRGGEHPRGDRLPQDPVGRRPPHRCTVAPAGRRLGRAGHPHRGPAASTRSQPGRPPT